MPAEKIEIQDRRRRLARSQFVTEGNYGSEGSGFVYGTDYSTIIFKGQNLVNNRGKEGGVIALRESSFYMENSVAEGQSAENFGGFMSAINSVYNIEISIIEESKSNHGCVIFAEGKHIDPGSYEKNQIYRVNIRNNVCESSLLQVINTDLTVENVYFNDNE